MGNVTVKLNDKTVQQGGIKLLITYDKKVNGMINNALKTSNYEMAEVLVRRMEPYIPVDTGKLINSTALYVENDNDAKIVYDVDYAEYAYKRRYRPKAGYGKRGSRWFERMWVDYKAQVLNSFYSSMRRKLK